MNAVTQPKATGREWAGLAVLALACVLYSMDLTVLHLAVPRLSADLMPTSAQLLWIVDIYGFVLAGALITMGTLGDRIGRRRVLLIGAAAFAAASVFAAFSTSAEMLIVARAVLGLAGATIAPSTLSLIRNMFLDPKQRTAAIGIWVMSFSAGGAIGPLVGGGLLEFFWWGSVFLAGVPVMAVLLVLGPIVLPEYRDHNARRLDLVSAGMSLAAVLVVIYGLKRIAEDGLGWVPILSIVAGLAVGVLFLRRQGRLADPLIDVRLFRIPAFSASLATYTLATLALFGSFLFIFQYLQLVLGLSPLQAGLWSLPGFSGFIIGAMVTPKLARSIRPAFIMAVGLLLGAVGLGILTQVDGASGLAFIVAGMFAMAIGFAPVITLATDLIVGTAPAERAGAAAAISETGSEFGGALGIAVMGSIGTAVYRSQIADAAPTGVAPAILEAARDTLGGAVAAAGQLPEGLGLALLTAARGAFADGLQVVAAIGAALSIGLVVLVLVSLRNVVGSAGTGPQDAPVVDLGLRAEGVPSIALDE